MELIKFGGMSIRVHPTFILILILYGALGLLSQALIVFALVIGHELAHLLTAKAYGFKVTGLEIFPLGGAAYCEGLFEGRKIEESTIALAGPAFNLILIFVAQGLRWQGWWEGQAAEDFVRYNFWLAAFNLIPVLPLDGGRVVRALFSDLFGFVRMSKALAWAGKLFGVILGIWGLTLWGTGNPVEGSLSLALLAGFFWLAGNKEISAARLTFLRQLTRKKEELKNKGLLRSKVITVYRDTPLVRIIEEFTPDSYAMISLVNEEFGLSQTFTETDIVEGLLTQGIHYPVGKLEISSKKS